MRIGLIIAACLVTLPMSVPGEESTDALGPREETEIIEGPESGDFCPGTELLENGDGSYECAYAWQLPGVQPPDYGSWAECYDSEFVCGIQFLFVQLGYYDGETMDVYVWEDDGMPPPDNNPGNVICAVMDVDPGPPVLWPYFSTHDVQVCCATGGAHFIGFWGNWPGEIAAWFVGADCDGGGGCPRTKIAPGIGYPTGWAHPNVVPSFDIEDLGIREFSGVGDCSPTTVRQTTWGRIKALQ
jgi:hypothetical protein